MRYPVNNHVITSDYGYRVLRGNREFHDGIDFISRESNIVYAVAGGTVIFDMDNYDDSLRWSKPEHSAGNYVIISHEINGALYYCRYLHLGKNFVSIKERVIPNTRIGTYADAGRSYGAHLHFDVYTEKWEKINPHIILDFINELEHNLKEGLDI